MSGICRICVNIALWGVGQWVVVWVEKGGGCDLLIGWNFGGENGRGVVGVICLHAMLLHAFFFFQGLPTMHVVR